MPLLTTQTKTQNKKVKQKTKRAKIKNTKSGLILFIRALPNIIDLTLDDHEEGLLETT